MHYFNYLLGVLFIVHSFSAFGQEINHQKSITLIAQFQNPDRYNNLSIQHPFERNIQFGRAEINEDVVTLTVATEEFFLYEIWIDAMSSVTMTFYPETDTVILNEVNPKDNIYEMEFMVKSGPLTQKFQTEKFNAMNDWKPKIDQIIERYGEPIRTYKNGEDIKENPMAWEKIDSLRQHIFLHNLTHTNANVSYPNFDILLQNIWAQENNPKMGTIFPEIRKKVEQFSLYHSDSFYKSYANTVLANLKGRITISKGNLYIPVVAQDSTQNDVDISAFVSDSKYLLLDIWATWCGSCIRKSHNTIPVFEKFKDKGFHVLGIVTEVKSHEAYIKTLKKQNYPWTLLSDINNKNNIRALYGQLNQGGEQILVNHSGEIVMINPTAEELEAFLSEHL